VTHLEAGRSHADPPAGLFGHGPVDVAVTTKLASAREAVVRASDESDDETVHEQLDSIDVGLKEMTEREETPDDEVSTAGDVPHGDDLQGIEAQLADLMDLTDGAALRHIEDARTAIDEYRRAYTRDWNR
jgi:hypothetical protein